MGTVTVLLVVIAVIVVCWVVAMLASLWLLARRNRVAADARTGAPLHWLAAPSRAAVAHRRLRRAVSGARAALGGVPEDAAVRGDVVASVALLERQAVDLDHRLVVAARCPAATRWRLVNDLEPQVREVERIGSQLAEVALIAAPRPPGAGEGLDALTARLRALADARAELDEMDEAAVGQPPAATAAATPALPPAGVQVPGPEAQAGAGQAHERQPVARRGRQPDG